MWVRVLWARSVVGLVERGVGGFARPPSRSPNTGPGLESSCLGQPRPMANKDLWQGRAQIFFCFGGGRSLGGPLRGAAPTLKSLESRRSSGWRQLTSSMPLRLR